MAVVLSSDSCDICKRKLMQCVVDGKTRSGQWAYMCPDCRIEEGRIELGTGLGQKYERGPWSNQAWVKTAG